MTGASYGGTRFEFNIEKGKCVVVGVLCSDSQDLLCCMTDLVDSDSQLEAEFVAITNILQLSYEHQWASESNLVVQTSNKIISMLGEKETAWELRCVWNRFQSCRCKFNDLIFNSRFIFLFLLEVNA